MINKPYLADRTSATPIILRWSLTALAAVAIFGPITLQIKIPIYELMAAGIAALVIIAAILRAAADLIERQCTWYQLTPTQLKIRHGVFTKDERTIPLTAIQSTRIRWPLVGRLLNYGTIRIELMGNYPSLLFLVDNPAAWRDALEHQPTRTLYDSLKSTFV
jgi:uncharacterized membrane protein YdbT with pleckstrin-like domain